MGDDTLDSMLRAVASAPDVTPITRARSSATTRSSRRAAPAAWARCSIGAPDQRQAGLARGAARRPRLLLTAQGAARLRRDFPAGRAHPLRLGREERTLLILRVDRNLSFAEVADILGVDEPAARKRFERTKEKLRQLAEKAGLLKTS